jgi:hypothetical protein
VVKQGHSGPRPPAAYYDALDAGNRWFSTGIVFAILALLSTIPTQVVSVAWILVGLFTAAALFCFARLLQYALLSGRVRRAWRRSIGATHTPESELSVQEFMASHPIISGSAIFLLGMVVIIVVAFAHR